MKSGRIYLILSIILIIVLVSIAGTFAYWTWVSSSTDDTSVTFTLTQQFSCSADGGGDITSSDITLAPASCTNSNYAIKRKVVVDTTISDGNPIYLDMWLNVNSIGSGISGTTNFKYALTSGSTSCTDGVVNSGNFNGASSGTKKTLLSNVNYTQSSSSTYYLWIWLDAAETNNNTQSKSFNFSLGGVCDLVP